MEKITANPRHYPLEPLLDSEQQEYRYSKFLKFWKIFFQVSKRIIYFWDIFHIKEDSKKIKKLKN